LTHVAAERRHDSSSQSSSGRCCHGVLVSAASAWELAIKSATGKLPLREPVRRWLPAAVDSAFEDYDVKLPDARR
jgi:PIN domain nuclease of toxin-antitoxin system